MNWFQFQWERLKAFRLKLTQDAKLAEHARREAEKTAEFFQSLGERIVADHLPTRCDAVYETVLNWAGDNNIKRKQAALYLFLWEVEEKKNAMAWEVSDIAHELDQMWDQRVEQ
jgi:hypothetical protein